jgi:tripartite-type tricarboxylate transporter receptor subunit TctC
MEKGKPVVLSVVTGETDLMFRNIAPARQRDDEREAFFAFSPDVPTMAESGEPGFETLTHYGVLASGTPREIVSRLNAVLVSGLQSGDTRKRLQAICFLDLT